MKKMLRHDTLDRLSIEEVAAHVWFSTDSQRPDIGKGEKEEQKWIRRKRR